MQRALLHTVQHSPFYFIYSSFFYVSYCLCTIITLRCRVIEILICFNRNFPFRMKWHVNLHRFDLLTYFVWLVCDLVTIQVNAVPPHRTSHIAHRKEQQQATGRNQYKFTGPTFQWNQFTLILLAYRFNWSAVANKDASNGFCSGKKLTLAPAKTGFHVHFYLVQTFRSFVILSGKY